MKLTVKKKESNLLLSREEIEAIINVSDATPSFAEVKKELSSKIGKPEELTVIKSIYQQFGSDEAKVSAFVYDSKENLDKIEPKLKVKKEKKAKAEQKTEKKE